MSYLDELFELGQVLNRLEQNDSPESTNTTLETTETKVNDKKVKTPTNRMSSLSKACIKTSA